MITAIADTLDGPRGSRINIVARTFAMLAGALMIARASDPERAELVLGAVRGQAGALAKG